MTIRFQTKTQSWNYLFNLSNMPAVELPDNLSEVWGFE